MRLFIECKISFYNGLVMSVDGIRKVLSNKLFLQELKGKVCEMVAKKLK